MTRRVAGKPPMEEEIVNKKFFVFSLIDGFAHRKFHRQSIAMKLLMKLSVASRSSLASVFVLDRSFPPSSMKNSQ